MSPVSRRTPAQERHRLDCSSTQSVDALVRLVRKYNTQALAIRTKSLYVVRHLLVMAPVVLVLFAVFEEHAVKVLDVIFRLYPFRPVH